MSWSQPEGQAPSGRRTGFSRENVGWRRNPVNFFARTTNAGRGLFGGRRARERRVTEAPVWFVGVDGGATRCRARVRDAEGRALAEATGAAANVHVDFEAAAAVMRAVVGEALGKAGLGPDDRPRIALGLGLAGVSDGADIERVVAAFSGYGRVSAANDASTACIGA